METREPRVPRGAWLIEQETIGETETWCKSYSGINAISLTIVETQSKEFWGRRIDWNVVHSPEENLANTER